MRIISDISGSLFPRRPIRRGLTEDKTIRELIGERTLGAVGAREFGETWSWFKRIGFDFRLGATPFRVVIKRELGEGAIKKRYAVSLKERRGRDLFTLRSFEGVPGDLLAIMVRQLHATLPAPYWVSNGAALVVEVAA